VITDGAADGQLAKGECGSSATYVYTDLFDSYNFVQDQVVLKYRESTGERAQVLADYEAGKLDFVLQDSPLPDQLNPPGAERIVEVPILGNAVSFVHSVYLPPINGTTPNLNLSRATLARIFAGAVRTWDDDAIKADNPRLPEGTLPPDNITLVIRSGQPGINAVLLKALANFDAGFASVLAASNGSLGASHQTRLFALRLALRCGYA
jgi:ABC-type phosphate transport system substrate-binding protein